LANAQFESKNTQSIDTSQAGSMLARFFLTMSAVLRSPT
jgi:hypothetical protein